MSPTRYKQHHPWRILPIVLFKWLHHLVQKGYLSNGALVEIWCCVLWWTGAIFFCRPFQVQRIELLQLCDLCDLHWRLHLAASFASLCFFMLLYASLICSLLWVSPSTSSSVLQDAAHITSRDLDLQRPAWFWLHEAPWQEDAGSEWSKE